MKKISLYIAIMILSFGIIFSETQISDSSKKAIVELEKTDSLKSAKSIINADSLANQGNNKRRMRNKFIDQDGDGINDNRCNGLGPNQGKGMGKRKRMGKK